MFTSGIRRFFPDWESRQYKETFRVDKDTFWFLYRRYGVLLAKRTDGPRPPILTEKRFAIVMHWLATGCTYHTLAMLYNVSKPVVVNILHDARKAWRYTLVPDAIVFPTSLELDRVMTDFEAHCFLPHCAGAIDGTFMFHKKPSKYGDSFWCYKHGHAIIVLGVVDARGIFTFVDVGRAGSVGDSVAWQRCTMRTKVENGEWMRRQRASFSVAGFGTHASMVSTMLPPAGTPALQMLFPLASARHAGKDCNMLQHHCTV